MTASIFEAASRKKFRFESPKGLLTVEDLWDLPLTSNTNKANLDEIAKTLYGKLKSEDCVSFVNTSQKTDTTTQTMFDIVKHVIDVKKAERDAAAQASERASKKQAILSVIAQKEDQALLGMDVEELRKLAESL